MRRVWIAIAIFAAGMMWGCTKPAPPPTNFKLAYAGPSVQGLALNYTNYAQITEGSVSMNPYLALRCLGAPDDAVEKARKHLGDGASCAIRIYMNRAAARAFRGGLESYPVGAAIIKRASFSNSHGQAGTPPSDLADGVGGMVKRATGYDPKHGDWEFLYFEDPAKVEHGHIASCASCHEAAKATDFVFGTWRKEPDNAKGH